ncbi:MULTISPECIES: MaoC family dehydratase [unclassified Brevibacterium]|uniref:MaoC family dehydratase n=1 Tax=unclassified Brevibacterium TaxID=2614124 RepID=UPI0027962921|nr:MULTISPECIES: MaoC family dehydratase [unclassified Brevibacterium]
MIRTRTKETIMVREIKGYDGLMELVGQELGKSDWFEVTQERVNMFADATGDHQWIHIDQEKAKNGPFGTTIAHGFLTLSLLPVLGAQVQKVTGMKMAINYGCNKVRFPSPVPVGSKVQDTIVLKEVNRKPSGIQVVMEHTIAIEGAERPACVAESVTVMVEE